MMSKEFWLIFVGLMGVMLLCAMPITSPKTGGVGALSVGDRLLKRGR